MRCRRCSVPLHATIQAHSDAAYRRLIGRLLEFYRDNLLNPHWGEQIVLKENRVLTLHLVSQDLAQATAERIWKPFFDGVTGSPEDFSFIAQPGIIDLPARGMWNPEVLRGIPGIVKSDDRVGAGAGNVFWAGDAGQCGQVLHGYDSLWLPATLLDDQHRQGFADALCAAAQRWEVVAAFEQGTWRARRRGSIDAARDTATNPAFLMAFALAIIGAEEPPAYPGIPGHEPDVAEARSDARGVQQAMAELRKVVPDFASYVSESNFFEKQWQRAFWGDNYPRLLKVKTKYDPDGLFVVHHGVGSESWSDDGFTRLGPQRLARLAGVQLRRPSPLELRRQNDRRGRALHAVQRADSIDDLIHLGHRRGNRHRDQVHVAAHRMQQPHLGYRTQARRSRRGSPSGPP